MSRSYACIISPDVKRDKEELIFVARQFSYSIEMLDDGVLFDVSGLENLIGDADQIAQKIDRQLEINRVDGNAAVADTADTAILLARQDRTLDASDKFSQLPLWNLEIEPDTLNVFDDLGIRKIQDLRQIPADELINRYGQKFMDVIDVIEQKGKRLLTPSIKESSVSWTYDLDFPADDFEQLIFIVNHGLDKLFSQVAHFGLSTEQLDISFGLQRKKEKAYEIKTSFPTLERAFWLKLVNLRISLDPPEAAIQSVSVVAHFTKSRPNQRGLYAVSRPEPESLLLTVNKLKKLVGEDNVGVPVMLDQRSAEAFDLDANALPQGQERIETHKDRSIIAFSYFRPPVQAEVLVRDKQLVFLRTQYFSGRVLEYSGVWRANSKWWDKSWKTEEWDVEIENNGVYRLCKAGKEWFLIGEYD